MMRLKRDVPRGLSWALVCGDELIVESDRDLRATRLDDVDVPFADRPGRERGRRLKVIDCPGGLQWVPLGICLGVITPLVDLDLMALGVGRLQRVGDRRGRNSDVHARTVMLLRRWAMRLPTLGEPNCVEPTPSDSSASRVASMVPFATTTAHPGAS